MQLFIEKEKKEISSKFSGKVKDLLKSLNINPEGVLVVRNGELITEENFVGNGDSIKILSVISGG